MEALLGRLCAPPPSSFNNQGSLEGGNRFQEDNMRDTKIGSALADRNGCAFFPLEQDDLGRSA